MEKEIKRIDGSFSVTGQLVPSDLTAVVAHGFRSVICNRPDHEGGASQPTHTALEHQASLLGLQFSYLPVQSGRITPDQVEQLRNCISELPKPILAFCRTGNRSSMLYGLATAALPQPAHYDVVVIGGGSAGIAITASLLKRNASLRIAVVEPSSQHYYQPAWTLVGGGLYDVANTVRPMGDVMPTSAHWHQASLATFAPERHAVQLGNGRELTYQQLIVCPGLEVVWKEIEGLEETLGKNGVTSNYRYDLAPYTWQLVRELRGGKAIFTQPAMPIKCAGAPQKAMYLACDYWSRQGVLDKTSVEFNLAGSALFGVPAFVPPLMKYVQRYRAHLAFQSNLVKVDGPSRTAWFDVTDANGNTAREMKTFDLLHVVPPQRAPEVIRQSELADKNGWFEVDPTTLQHPRYPEIFALGDVCGTGNAKTAAAVRKQAVVVAENVIAHRQGAPLPQRYDGYGSCPLTVEKGKVILAEFGYGGKLLPTFPLKPTVPRRSAWLLKASFLPWFYWHAMLKGREWFTDCSDA